MFEGLQENPHKRLVEMFHAGTPQKVKNAILEKMTSSENFLRILICTSTLAEISYSFLINPILVGGGQICPP